RPIPGYDLLSLHDALPISTRVHPKRRSPNARTAADPRLPLRRDPAVAGHQRCPERVHCRLRLPGPPRPDRTADLPRCDRPPPSAEQHPDLPQCHALVDDPQPALRRPLMIRLITTKRLEALKYAAARLEETTAEKEDLAALVAALQEDMAGTEETLNNVRAEASRLQQRVAELEGTPVGVLEAENRELAARLAELEEQVCVSEPVLWPLLKAYAGVQMAWPEIVRALPTLNRFLAEHSDGADPELAVRAREAMDAIQYAVGTWGREGPSRDAVDALLAREEQTAR